MSLKDKEKWNSKHQAPGYIAEGEPAEWLVLNSELLSGPGKALDLAAGDGRNAVYAAARGYDVLALDISEVGLGKARKLANEKEVAIQTEVADLDSYRFEKDAYDLILCFNFLDRNLFPGMRQALKSGGLIYYETFNLDHLNHTSFKREWVLEYNELLKVFQDFRILRYREVEADGITSLVARKPGA